MKAKQLSIRIRAQASNSRDLHFASNNMFDFESSCCWRSEDLCSVCSSLHHCKAIIHFMRLSYTAIIVNGRNFDQFILNNTK